MRSPRDTETDGVYSGNLGSCDSSLCDFRMRQREARLQGEDQAARPTMDRSIRESMRHSMRQSAGRLTRHSIQHSTRHPTHHTTQRSAHYCTRRSRLQSTRQSMPVSMQQARDKARGFTLIEVMVALTITGFLLGGLFALVAGSKRLSSRAETALARSLQQRAAFNAALLDNDFADLDSFLSTASADYRVVELDELEFPDRQTQPLPYALQALELQSPDGDTEVVATRWQRLGVGASE